MTADRLDHSLAISLFGTDQPVPERTVLSAGPLEATWEAGALRNIRYGGIEIVRGIAFLSRDESWGNIPVEIANVHVVQEETRFHLSCDLAFLGGQQRLAGTVDIAGSSNGSLTFSASAAAETDFATNRTGFTILHPLKHMVGQTVDVTHTDGTRTRQTIPERISPGQPIFDIRSLAHDLGPGLRVATQMEGAKFEMEDHRNWMDASFKTYAGSLLDPWPYVIVQGERVTQSVIVTVTGKPPARAVPSDRPELTVSLGDRAGVLPDLGTAMPTDPPADLSRCVGQLKHANPAYLVMRMDGRQFDLDRQAADLRTIARTTDTPLHLEMILSATNTADRELEELATALGRHDIIPAAVVVTQAHDMLSFQPGDPRPAGPCYLEMATAARRAFPGIPVGGGMVAFFTELNRLPVPHGVFDFVTHAVCPAVHASDDQSLMENLEVAKWIFASARAMIGSTPYHLGPSWISSRVNPYGAAVSPNPTDERICLAESDPRQRGIFGASWALGLVAAAAEAGLDAVALASLAGPQGLTIGPDDRKPPEHPSAEATPAFHVLRGLAAQKSRHSITTTISDPEAIAGLGIETTAGPELWLANLTAEERDVHVDPWHGPAVLHELDHARYSDALRLDFLDSPGRKVDNAASLRLAPYATARLSPAVE